MLDTITTDNILHWQCRGGEEDEWCGEQCECHIDETVYQEAIEQEVPGRGAVIVLPACPVCGAVTSLKADYRLKELYKALQEVTDPETGSIVHVLPYRYIRNLQAHWMLYERGRAAYAPVLPMPPIALLAHESFASVKQATVMALWFGYLAAREYVPALKEQPPQGLIEGGS
jgi:hypothetical protein